MTTLEPEILPILYRNHRGATRVYTVMPQRIWFGQTAWHPGPPQWLLDAHDVERNVERTFALREIIEFGSLGPAGGES